MPAHLLAAFGEELQFQTLSKPDMPFEQGCCTEGPVLRQVLPVADPQVRGVEQENEGRKGRPLGSREPLRVSQHMSAQSRQRVAKSDQLIEFLLVAQGLPECMIAILFSAPVIIAGRLQVAFGKRADPDAAVGGRNSEAGNPRFLGGVRKRLAGGKMITEAAAALAPRDAWLAVADINEASLPQAIRILRVIHVRRVGAQNRWS